MANQSALHIGKLADGRFIGCHLGSPRLAVAGNTYQEAVISAKRALAYYNDSGSKAERPIAKTSEIVTPAGYEIEHLETA